MSFISKQKTMLRQAMVVEALLRLKNLGLSDKVIQAFCDEGTVMVSDEGTIRTLDSTEYEMVQNFEHNKGYIVFHCVKGNTEYGQMLSLLYVDTCSDEWVQTGIEMIENGMSLTYAANQDFPELSEFGSIGISLSPSGGLIRTW